MKGKPRKQRFTRDGRRLILSEPVEYQRVREPSIRVVRNWFAEFRGREQD